VIPLKETTSRIHDLKYKIGTIELLNLAKKTYTYRELSAIIHLPETVLSRYVKGHVLPTTQRAVEINEILQKYMSLEKDLMNKIKFDDQNYFDNTEIINNPMLMERCVQYAIDKFGGKRINRIMTAAVDGIPLATLLAQRLGIPLVIAKKNREVGVREFIEEVFTPHPKTAIIRSLYVSKDAIQKGNAVLIVDDIIDTGETQRALIKIAQRARAEVTGIFALFSVGNDWKSRIESMGNIRVEVVAPLMKKEAPPILSQ
jgi:adenine phosphoribosyltransferase